ALLAVVVVCIYVSHSYLQAAQFPNSLNLGPDLAEGINDLTTWLVSALHTITEAFKNRVSYDFLNPLQELLANTPWWMVAPVLLAFAFVFGGWRPLAVTVLCEAVIFGTG